MAEWALWTWANPQDQNISMDGMGLLRSPQGQPVKAEQSPKALRSWEAGGGCLAGGSRQRCKGEEQAGWAGCGPPNQEEAQTKTTLVWRHLQARSSKLAVC